MSSTSIHSQSENPERPKGLAAKKFGAFLVCAVAMGFVLANVHSIQRGYGVLFGILGFVIAALPLAVVMSVIAFPLALVCGGDTDAKRFWRCAATASGVAAALGVIVVFLAQPTADQMHMLGAALIIMAAAGILPARKLHIEWRNEC